jgi:endoglucanase
VTTTLDKNLVKALVEAWGPSGYEYQVRDLIRTYVEALADDIRVDAGGSLICHIGSTQPNAKKIMIAAHMDEIGLMVHHIDSDGYARFSPMGGLFPITLYGNRVRFADGTIGSIGLDNWSGQTKVPGLADFFVDFSGGDYVAKVGDVATLWRDYVERGDRLIAKSLDDRIGCVVAIEAMRQIKASAQGSPHDLYFVFTTQEEVGIRGARTSAYGVAPDFGIALDVAPSGDNPKSEKVAITLGGGAAIKVRDVGHIIPPAVKNLMIKRATEAGIRYQLEVLDMGTTDGAAIQTTGAGVPTGAISIPVRYVHTTSETVDSHDVEACVDLLVAIVSQPLDSLT